MLLGGTGNVRERHRGMLPLATPSSAFHLVVRAFSLHFQPLVSRSIPIPLVDRVLGRYGVVEAHEAEAPALAVLVDDDAHGEDAFEDVEEGVEFHVGHVVRQMEDEEVATFGSFLNERKKKRMVNGKKGKFRHHACWHRTRGSVG